MNPNKLSPKQQAKQQAAYQFYLDHERDKLEKSRRNRLFFSNILGKLVALLLLYLLFTIGWKPVNNYLDSLFRSFDVDYVKDR